MTYATAAYAVRTDPQVFAFAQREQAVLISRDMDFGNILDFPLGTHDGILIAHFPNDFSVSAIKRQITQATVDLSTASITGNLVILEPGSIRIRTWHENR